MIIMIEVDEALKWLDLEIYAKGGVSKLARAIGADPAAISRMRYGDRSISGKVAEYLKIKKVHGEDRYAYTIPDDQRY